MKQTSTTITRSAPACATLATMSITVRGSPGAKRRNSHHRACRNRAVQNAASHTPGTGRQRDGDGQRHGRHRPQGDADRVPPGPAGPRVPGAPGRLLAAGAPWFADRSFWLLAWSGAFERHPELRMVMTEQGATWVPDTLAQMDHAYTMPMFRHLRRQLPLSPSEYFARQCYVSPFLGQEEAEARDAIGVDKLMWGSDYPHIEGTWPHTEAKLKEGLRRSYPRSEPSRSSARPRSQVFGFDQPR